ncbi:MAG: class I SAM-dependent methyltransferase [Burkholderiaceae bacterium]|nr:MAG: class I SAM-dependent methyltransferase [Burkholderiaceae bacterium]
MQPSTLPNQLPAQLPVPDASALAHSQQLQKILLQRIEAAGGWMGFDTYMETALYEPGLGYYSGGATKFGPAGDFVTAPELSPLFGATLARPIADWLRASASQVLEFGAGSGALAAQLLNALGSQDCAPEQYFILELSGTLRARQQETLARVAPQWAERVRWLDALPENFDGVMLGNEVLDAMPVRLFVKHEGLIRERGVASHRGQCVFADAPADAALGAQITALETHLGGALPDGYVSEVCPAASAFIASVAACLQRGVVLLIDYGFPAREYYHPQRTQGTLMCHYRHHAHGDPFLYPGLQDITAHVDFSALAHAAHDAGLTLLGYTSQARALINAGITELAANLDRNDLATFLPAARGLQTLMAESEMGELFKMIAFGTGSTNFDTTLFNQGNRHL